MEDLEEEETEVSEEEDLETEEEEEAVAAATTEEGVEHPEVVPPCLSAKVRDSCCEQINQLDPANVREARTFTKGE